MTSDILFFFLTVFFLVLFFHLVIFCVALSIHSASLFQSPSSRAENQPPVGLWLSPEEAAKFPFSQEFLVGAWGHWAA